MYECVVEELKKVQRMSFGYSVTFETFSGHCCVCTFRSTPVCHDIVSVVE